MESASLVSVVMATYNSEKYVHDSVRSVLNQRYQNWELLITDDASSDRTWDVLISLAEKDSRVSLFRQAVNSGPAEARNMSIRHAKGRYIAFLDSDDLWLEDKLAHHLNFLQQSGEAVSFTSYSVIDDSGCSLGQNVDVHVPLRLRYQDLLLKKATFGCSTVMIDRAKVGDFQMPLLRTGQDYACWLMLLRRGHVAARCPEILTRYRVSPGSISRNKFRKALRQWEIYREVEGLPVPKAAWCFVNYAYRAVFRK